MSSKIVNLLTLDSAKVCDVLSAAIDLALAEARARGDMGIHVKSPGGRKDEARFTEAEAASGELTNAAAAIRRFACLRPTVEARKES